MSGAWRWAASIVVAFAALGSGVSIASAVTSSAPLTEPAVALERALECHGDLRSGRAPVILVSAMGTTPHQAFSFGYARVLPNLGFAVCTVRLPGPGIVDMQRLIQYVVYAIREVARRSGRTVSLIGISQAAMLNAYAPYFWPDLPEKIDDVIGLAGTYRGTTWADAFCADGACPVFAWQFRTTSRFVMAFRDRAQPTGPSFTAIATATDELVMPAPQAATLDGASNVVIQRVCPARPVEHVQTLVDAVVFAIAMDALTHPGPADPRRIDPATCLQVFIPGADLVGLATIGAPGGIAAIARLGTEPDVAREPTLRCPFDPADCAVPSPQLRLTRRCVPGGRLRMALAGDVQVVRDVSFKIGSRLIRRDRAEPFRLTADRRTLKPSGARRLRAIANLRTPSGAPVVLSRSIPSC